MNVPQSLVSPLACPDGFNFAAFNQDSGCFLAATHTGVAVFNADPVRKNNDTERGGIACGVKRAEMLFR